MSARAILGIIPGLVIALSAPESIKAQEPASSPKPSVSKSEDSQGAAARAVDRLVEQLKLSPKGQRRLASLVSEGMRAFTIKTNVASGVAGFILPGNKVDVILTVDSSRLSTVGSIDRTGGGSTTTLLQNVEILAVDQKVEAPAENKVNSNDLRSVTLLVTPSQAAKLSLGQSKGDLHLERQAVQPRPEPERSAPDRFAIYLMDVASGEATLVADQPAPGLLRCGSPVWSHDGRRILFDATPGANFRLSRLESIDLGQGRPTVTDFGAGNCPTFSPADDRIAFLSNADGVQNGVWLMKADGSGRRPLGGYAFTG
jgi:Flp pilus assembly protein CpaB